MQSRSEETRQRILHAALTAISRDGYDATGVAEICSEAGVSKGAFYHHFPTKQAVFLTLLEDWLADIDRGLSSALEGSATVAEGLLRMVAPAETAFQSANDQLPMFLEFWTQASHDPAVWQATIAPYRRYEGYFAQLIRRGIEDGSFQPVDPDLAARTLVSLAVGLFLQSILDPQGAAWDEVALGSIRLLMNGLSRREA
ncbi:MAG TPA: TetR/AcrR family transcriptional regulator [Anaerolineaceae bacterium]